jgi:hypothetical protein
VCTSPPSTTVATSHDSCEIAATAATGPRGCGPSEPVGRPRLPVRAGPSATTFAPTRRATVSLASPLEIPSSRASRARVIPGSAWTARSTPIAVEDRAEASRSDAVRTSIVVYSTTEYIRLRASLGAAARRWQARNPGRSRPLRLGRGRLLVSRIEQRQASPALASQARGRRFETHRAHRRRLVVRRPAPQPRHERTPTAGRRPRARLFARLARPVAFVTVSVDDALAGVALGVRDGAGLGSST